MHESEEYDKVANAFSLFFPKKAMKEETAPGVFGTFIKIVRAEINKKSAQELVQKIVGSLSTEEKKRILNELKLRLSEDGKFYLRFDKQVAYSDEKMVLTSEEEDSIQVVLALEAYPANIAGYAKAAKAIFS